MTTHAQAGAAAPAGFSFRPLVLPRLSSLADGQLTLREGGASTTFGNPARDGLAAEVVVRNPAFWRRVATGGTLGAAESYADGDWDTPDLTAVVRLVARNVSAMDGLEAGLAALRRPVDAVRHALRRNTRSGSRRNITEHYDLGDDFFQLMLDPTMTYSCGIFERPESTLEEASIAKIDRLCRMLRLGPDDHLLEIGSGWGAFALHAASRYGCRVTTTTISANQLARARRRIADAGLSDSVTVLHTDYRDLTGQFDKLVSVEMLEAVGADYYGTFFQKCASLLTDEGLMALQTITIADARYDQHVRGVDFIKRHVFPGSNIPSITALLQAATRNSDLTLRRLDDIGPHYATTLAAWRENLARNAEAVSRITEERFRRIWHYYLCYCEAGFAEGYLGDAQMLLARPRGRA
ncbi:MAG: cyclopropane-fatty-acyl-phospholipid synthase family protein [Anaeromyxobacteraceae bacterium]